MLLETEYQQHPEILTPEQFAEQGTARQWNFTQCQAFLLNINGREVYFLNVSLTPDNVNHYQEYAVVVPTQKRERYPGYDFAWLVEGQLIDSLTVNASPITADWLMTVYGNPENDVVLDKVMFVIVTDPEKHICDCCA